MKLRRVIFGSIACAGFVVILLAILGVFTSRKELQAPGAPGGSAGEGLQVTAENIEVTGENWMLKGKRAERSPEGGMTVQGPVVEMRRADSGKEQRMILTADIGEAPSEKYERLKLRNHVRVEFLGEDSAVLTTDSVEIEPDGRIGRTADEVRLVVTTRDGTQTLVGKGAEFIFKQRTVTLRENIRMYLVGGADLFAAPNAVPAKEAAPVARTPTHITCNGPAVADGFRNTVELMNDVKIRQGDNELRADRAEVRFSEADRAPERITAEGHIRFKTGDASGSGQRLVRVPQEDQLLLEGEPAIIQSGASEIRAPKIELNARQGGILVPSAGNLKLAPEKGDTAGPVAVQWSRTLSFDPKAHAGSFRGAVRFARGEQTLICDALDVKFSDDNRQAREVRARGNVRLKAPSEKGDVDAQARELTYLLERELVTLDGNVVVQQGEQVIRGERIEVRKQDAMAVTGAGSLESRPAGEGQRPVAVAWSGGMQFDRAAQTAVFRRDVLLTAGAEALRADTINAKFTGNERIESFEAVGNVAIRQPVKDEQQGRTLRADKVNAVFGAGNQLRQFIATGRASVEDAAAGARRTIRGNRIVADAGAQGRLSQFEVTGDVLLEETGGATVKARSLKADRIIARIGAEEHLERFEAIGRVVLTEAGDGHAKGRMMKADKIVAAIGGDNQLENFEATGRTVFLEEDGRIARGQKLTWDAKRDLGMMSGCPAELQQAGNRVFGEYLEFSRERGFVRVSGQQQRVEGVLVPGKAIRLPRQ